MTNFDLKTLGLADGDYEITVVAKASGYKDSPPSNVVSYVVETEQPETVYSLPAGVYTFNNTLGVSIPDGGLYINFISNNTHYSSIYKNLESNSLVYEDDLPDSPTTTSATVYSFSTNSWGNNSNYKTIIVETTQYLSKEWHEYIVNNTLFDKLAGLWLFDPYLTYQSLDTINMNFQSNGQSYSSIKAEYNGDGLYLYFDNTLVCTTDQTIEIGSWIKEDYRYIFITSKLSEVTNGSNLLSWLNNRARRINDPLIGNWFWCYVFAYGENTGTYSLNYKSYNGTTLQNYTQISFSWANENSSPTGSLQTMRYNNTTVLNSASWINSSYKKINIISRITAVANGYELLNILKQSINGYNAFIVYGLMLPGGDIGSSSTVIPSLVLSFSSTSSLDKISFGAGTYKLYRNVVGVQLEGRTGVSAAFPYVMNGITDYLANQGAGNPSEYLELTNNIVIDTRSYNNGHCLTSDTLVTMADGTQKQLGEINVGEYVLSYNWETMQLVPNKVLWASKDDTNKTWQAVRYFKRTFSDGTIIKNVFAHRFYNLEDKMFKHLDFWNIGEHTYKADGTFPSLLKVEKVYENCTYARIICELGTNYFANGLLTGDSECPKNIDLSQIINKE